jgi:hypothetical protein
MLSIIPIHYNSKNKRWYLNKSHYERKASLQRDNKFRNNEGRAIAQAVSRWLPTAAAQVRAQV